MITKEGLARRRRKTIHMRGVKIFKNDYNIYIWLQGESEKKILKFLDYVMKVQMFESHCTKPNFWMIFSTSLQNTSYKVGRLQK